MEDIADVPTLAYFCKVWDRRHPDLKVSTTSHFQECPACVALDDRRAATRDVATRTAITRLHRWHLDVSPRLPPRSPSLLACPQDALPVLAQRCRLRSPAACSTAQVSLCLQVA